ncbi:uncharacterized protein MELLADRAFT_114593 [Melampsora larici-populina 98AG31]|uniref:Uncharacterized protein n=1 Tax=Melampsora larici-populina (strain 98AG31 / pathotype 3-4-7) TaxID=747676 RepID=F4SE28_MELLP|nr:uncharacterized protein MELLADRAFT_114593 [Melampsora larici-populina 98AG31]EGF97098.1 hypothetical protein MELLADRAFT_114593 [Melampsora larici-populina 98AG31]
MATMHMAPNTAEYKNEMMKCRVFHKDMRVDDRVHQRGLSRAARRAANRAHRSSSSIFGAKRDSKPRASTSAGPHTINLVSSSPDADKKLCSLITISSSPDEKPGPFFPPMPTVEKAPSTPTPSGGQADDLISYSSDDSPIREGSQKDIKPHLSPLKLNRPQYDTFIKASPK